MKARIWTSSMALAAALLGFTVVAQAHPGMMEHEVHEGRTMPHMQQMAQKMGLSAEQQKQLQALHDKQQTAMQANREQSKKLREERSAAWSAPTLDAARLENLRLQEVKLFDAMSRQRLEHRLAVANILTPEQRQKMASWKKDRHERKGRGHQDRD